ncbi:hypothetical protein JOF29_007175 [Kribbella aluminosa]|uniref:Uncharacterized protein n=1 Tax=Kribbella aluminosa TaxID=416017 RepID=A0ABS4UWQ4_9ACTN|nr:hypothetical protein [Kribbella aluminosa]MBP2356065.1 hypothetical protein [Kribbella aluminosa]
MDELGRLVAATLELLAVVDARLAVLAEPVCDRAIDLGLIADLPLGEPGQRAIGEDLPVGCDERVEVADDRLFSGLADDRRFRDADLADAVGAG